MFGSVIKLSVPGQLQFCDVARRVVMEACTLLIAGHLAGSSSTSATSGLSSRYQFDSAFSQEFISAFSEIFNNIALHAYQGESVGTIDFTIEITQDRLIVDIQDNGQTFDIDAVPLPDELPTGGMGIFIARTMLDELDYQPGPPNRWRLVKSVHSIVAHAAQAESSASQ